MLISDNWETLCEQPGTRPHRLSPRESARLMGFDIPAAGNSQIPVSDAQTYRQFGNYVITPILRQSPLILSFWDLSAQDQPLGFQNMPQRRLDPHLEHSNGLPDLFGA